jgi:flagellar basal-body rod protein FlgB
MSGLLSSLFDRGAPALARKLATFAEARQSVLADNIANIDTPGYKARDLPLAEFQQMLARASEESRATGGPLRFQSTRGVDVAADGNMTFTPVEREENNILFHDQGNRSIETEMSEIVKNALMHRVAVEVLRKQYETLEVAIRERL